MSNKKNILIIQPIHEEGIRLLESNPNYNYEVIENIKLEDIKNKIQNLYFNKWIGEQKFLKIM